MSELVLGAAPAVCAGCGTQVAAGLLSCPACDRLVHGDELRGLAAAADAATAGGDRAAALAHWQRAMTLLPPHASQRTAIAARIEALGPMAAAAQTPAAQPHGAATGRKAGALGVAMAFLLKGKTILLFLLTKVKLLVLGFSKLGTLLSMGAYFAYAWAAYGWAFGAGLVLSIYIHEMGHVSALRFYGMPAGAPLFVPGLGAFIRLKQHPPDERVDARIGLAGPVWGLAAALAAYGLFWATGAPVWAAVARVGAWINLFNLTPIWQLDGGRAFNSMSKRQRGMALGVVLLALVVTHVHMLLLVAGGAAYRLFLQRAPDRDDDGALWTYAALVLALAAMEMLPGMALAAR